MKEKNCVYSVPEEYSIKKTNFNENKLSVPKSEKFSFVKTTFDR
jgi:hypothetical protein